MKLILSVDALSPSLSGIGRYAWELVGRLPHADGVEQVRFYRAGSWVKDPADLLKESVAKRRRRLRLPRLIRDWYWQDAFRGQVFHAPNYFLPPNVQNGVVTVHDLSVFKYPETHPIERVRHFEKSFRQTLDVASHLITDSIATRQEVIEYFGWPAERVTAVHLGVSTAFSPRSSAEIQPVLWRYGLETKGYTLCVSTIEPRKGIDNLLAAYSRIPDALRGLYPLVLVGGVGWRSEHLHLAIEAGQKAGWLRYLGFVPERDLPLLYAGARLFVYPSSYEGFGLPVVEAMASGVPVITSDRSCLPEVAGGAARLVDPDDAVGLSTVIESSLSDLNWQSVAISDGLRVAARYNWDDCISRTVEVYARVLRRV